MRWFPVLALGALLAVGPSAQAGFMVGNPGTTKFHNEALTHLQARVTSLKWIGRNGQSRTQRPPAPFDPFQPGALVAPQGDWADVVLVLDGPVRIEGRTADGARFSASLDLGEWTIPLEDPSVSDSGRALDLELSLPAGLRGSMAPGQPGYADLLAAVRDGALAR